MPYQPINPDDLDGEALDTWYRRSPDDIEAARQAAAQQAYNDFFNAPPSANDSGGAGGDGPTYADQDVPTVTADSAGPALLQKMSYSPAGHVASAVASCPSCHLPLPPTVFPGWSVFRDALGAAASPPGGNDDKCNAQHDSDHQICGQFGDRDVRSVCRQRANTRYGHCIRTQQLDKPIPLLW